MTYAEFLQRFKKKAKRQKWALDELGYIRSGTQCPLSSLSDARAALAFEVGEDMGLHYRTMTRIVRAADNYPQANSRVRRDLLKACGLA
jgi:hypothetical protein